MLTPQQLDAAYAARHVHRWHAPYPPGAGHHSAGVPVRFAAGTCGHRAAARARTPTPPFRRRPPTTRSTRPPTGGTN